MRAVAIALLIAVAGAVAVHSAEVHATAHRLNTRHTVGLFSRPDLRISYGQKGPLGATNAVFRDLNTTGNGWCELFVNASAEARSPRANEDAAYAAGFIEGTLTVQQTDDAYYDTVDDWTVNGSIPTGVTDYITANWKWTEEQVAANKHDAFWREVGLLVAQLHGLVDGYKHGGGKQLELINFLYLNLDGDMPELVSAYVPSLHEHGFTNKPWSTHCSSSVRVTPSGNDLFHAHATWSSFDGMLRIFKNYQFDFLKEDRKEHERRKISFSSTPGFLTSGDDYYITHRGLVVTETTNNIYNNSLNDIIVNGGGKGVLLTWVRAMVANAVANSPKEWTELFVRYLSGTYPNQWIVTDMKRFIPGQALPDGLLWIVEEIPGYYESADVTSFLRTQGFWPSYNVPYFENIWNWMGYNEMEAQYGDDYSYTKCARAQIFARDTPSVTTFEEYRDLMTYNKWQTDPLSKGDPDNAIMARDDLEPSDPDAFGGIDCKLTCNMRAKTLSTSAMNGPTHTTQKPFQWSTSGLADQTKHRGQPDLFNFPFVVMCPDPSGAMCMN